MNAFKIERFNEKDRFKRSVGNETLLWHGSRMANFVGILSQGLRIAPPEAPVTGYMFGKGIYFADMVSKSANYCYAHGSDNIGLLLLCRVALGEPNKKYQADINAAKLPKGTNCTMGVGRTAPDPKEYKEFRGMTVPLGKGIESNGTNCSLLYNEFIVYDVAQVKIEYLVQCKFNNKMAY